MPNKIPISVFIKIEKSILKIMWKDKILWNSKNNPEQKTSNTEGITTLHLKLYYRAMVIRTSWY
jgi:hypothetical protein